MFSHPDGQYYNPLPAQVAAGTLDASTKIHAYRVDSVYGDTLKVASVLGQAGKHGGGPEGVGEEGIQEECLKLPPTAMFLENLPPKYISISWCF